MLAHFRIHKSSPLLSWISWIQSTTSQPISDSQQYFDVRVGHPNMLFLSYIPTEIFNVFLSCPVVLQASTTSLLILSP
jgi:hypothetical protein